MSIRDDLYWTSRLGRIFCTVSLVLAWITKGCSKNDYIPFLNELPFISAGATVNDVLTGCLAGAMRRYLTSTGVTAPSDLQIAVTINNRTMASVSEGRIPLENNSTGVFFSLPVAFPTLTERIKATKRRMDMIKNSTEYIVFGFLFKYFIATIPTFLARISNYAINRSCCMVMSNVPGPLNQLELVGR